MEDLEKELEDLLKDDSAAGVLVVKNLVWSLFNECCACFVFTFMNGQCFAYKI
jgi:hypothetical protein